MSNEIVKKSYIPAKITQQHLQNLEEASNDFYEICKQNDLSPITAIRRSAAMQIIRELLTPEVMSPIMSLQGSPLGFKTDKDVSREKDANGQRKKGEGYPVETVRDVFIYALGKGAKMINNEINIIAANPYPTKNFFFRKLDEVLGAENWKIVHDIPRIITSNGKTGAIVKSKVWWRDSASKSDGKTQELEFAVKGDDWATADSYTGKADRKAANWLLSNVTGERYLDGEVEDAFDVKAVEVKQSKFEQKKATSQLLNVPVKSEEQLVTEAIKDNFAGITVEQFMAHVKRIGYTVEQALSEKDDIISATADWVANEQ